MNFFIMLHQGYFLCECFITNVADMVFYSCVNQLVASYILSVCEQLMTVATGVLLPQCWCSALDIITLVNVYVDLVVFTRIEIW